MLNIEEIYDKFKLNAAYTFTTIDGDYPETRIAHFLTYDQEGLYFQAMKVKPFYKQLKGTSKLAVCSLVADFSPSVHNEDGFSIFPPGFFIKVSGDVKEISYDTIIEKAKNNERFLPLVNDIDRYPTMTTFVLYNFKGEVFDYDFEMKNRGHKVLRERFSFGNFKYIKSGFTISNKCISCGKCAKACTFKAIEKNQATNKYDIISNRCDECGSCYIICPVNAIIAKNNMTEEERYLSAKKLSINNK